MKNQNQKLAVCPYAAIWGCKKCPVKRVCPGKTTIGDQPRRKRTNRK
ncbi:TPA: hypothetical protein ACX6SL_001190 [Photobacterium damselae]